LFSTPDNGEEMSYEHIGKEIIGNFANLSEIMKI
jgi:hypothetical protein